MKRLDRLKFEHYVIVASAAAIALTALLIGPSAIQKSSFGEELTEGQSRQVTRPGTKALAMLLQKQGLDVVRHERRFDLLDEETRVLFSIAPRHPHEKDETRALKSWIRHGGTYVLMAGAPHGSWNAMSELGLELIDVKDEIKPAPAELELSSIWPALASTYRIAPGVRRRLRNLEKGPITWKSHVKDDAGIIAIAGRWDYGRVLVFCDSRVARNDALVTADHDALLVHVAKVASEGGPVAFDEYHHGHIEGQGPLAYILDTAAGPAVYHVLAILFLLVLATGRRLGRPLASSEGQRRRPLEFLEALARLFRASKHSGLAVRLILTDVMASMRTRFGSNSPQALAAAARRRGLNPDKILKPLEAAEKAARSRPSGAELLRHARALEEMRRLLSLSKGT